MRRSLQQWLWDGFYFQVELRSLYVNFRSIKGSYLEFTTGTKVSELVNLFFPPDNQEDSESTLSSSPCLNFSGTLPSFSNCKDKFFQIHLFPFKWYSSKLHVLVIYSGFHYVILHYFWKVVILHSLFKRWIKIWLKNNRNIKNRQNQNYIFHN